jgi:hypothetical protein
MMVKYLIGILGALNTIHVQDGFNEIQGNNKTWNFD